MLGRSKRANEKEEEEYEYEDDNSTVSTFAPAPVPVLNVTKPIAIAPPTTNANLIKISTPQSSKSLIPPLPEPTSEPVTKAEPKSKVSPQPEPEPEPVPKSEPKPKVEPKSQAEPTAEGEPNAQGTSDTDKNFIRNHCSFFVINSALHPMDCADIIIGSAVGSLSRVEDYYTISRATPMVDEVYGGSQSLSAATGIEENGVTTVMFRRKLITTDLADHNITDAVMQVIWAKGQEPGHYNHSPNSGLETNDGGAKKFYGPDVLAYHGHKNRGMIMLNFFEKPPKDVVVCRGEQVYPPGCQGSICSYNVTWMKIGDNVDFMMDVKMTTNRWTGIGFSKDGAMVFFPHLLS